MKLLLILAAATVVEILLALLAGAILRFASEACNEEEPISSPQN